MKQCDIILVDTACLARENIESATTMCLHGYTGSCAKSMGSRVSTLTSREDAEKHNDNDNYNDNDNNNNNNNNNNNSFFVNGRSIRVPRAS